MAVLDLCFGSLFGWVDFGVQNHLSNTIRDWRCFVLLSQTKLLFPTSPVPVVGEAKVLHRLSNGVGGMACEKKIVARVDSPCFRKVNNHGF
jgi:hypothetical protein